MPNTLSLTVPLLEQTPVFNDNNYDESAARTEWHISHVGADQVWKLGEFGKGKGTVYANADTGIQFDHPNIVGSYRGNHNGKFDHNYCNIFIDGSVV